MQQRIRWLLLTAAIAGSSSSAWAAIDYYCYQDCQKHNYAPQYCEAACAYTPQHRSGDYAVYPTYEPPGTSATHNTGAASLDDAIQILADRSEEIKTLFRKSP